MEQRRYPQPTSFGPDPRTNTRSDAHADTDEDTATTREIDGTSPGPSRTFRYDDFLSAIGVLKQRDKSPTTRKIAAEIDCHKEHALLRLHEMEDADLVTVETVGRSYVWHICSDGDDSGTG